MYLRLIRAKPPLSIPNTVKGGVSEVAEFTSETLNLSVFLCNTSAFGTCIQKYVIERYVCFIAVMVVAQTHVKVVATVH